MTLSPAYRALLQAGDAFTDRVGALTELGRRMWLSVPILDFGTYTPALVNVANVAASTASACQYQRVGSMVTVWGQVAIDPTAGATLTQLGIALPIPSALAAAEQCGGTAACAAVAGYVAAISGDATNDRAELAFTTGADVANRTWAFQFGYQVQ